MVDSADMAVLLVAWELAADPGLTEKIEIDLRDSTEVQ